MRACQRSAGGATVAPLEALAPRRAGARAAGGPSLEPQSWAMTLHGTERAIRAYSMLHAAAADTLEPEVEQRLQALRAGRVAPLLLRCLRLWKAGARRPARGPCAAPGRVACSHCCAPAPAASSGAGDRRALCPGQAVRMVAPEPRRAHARSPARAGAAHGRAPLCTGPAQLRAALRSAGERRVPDGAACLSARTLGNLLSVREVCMRVPGRERIRAMRRLYALLQWTAQRLAELVRARTERAAGRGHAARSLRSPAACLRCAFPKPAVCRAG